MARTSCGGHAHAHVLMRAPNPHPIIGTLRLAPKLNNTLARLLLYHTVCGYTDRRISEWTDRRTDGTPHNEKRRQRNSHLTLRRLDADLMRFETTTIYMGS